MKRLLLAVLAVGLIGCANQPATITRSRYGGYTYSRYSTSAEVWGHRNPAYRDWTTAQLQKRRSSSTAMTPFTTDRNEVSCLYLSRASRFLQQDEIKAIEIELNRRYQHGDKSAELKEFWPSANAGILPAAHV